MAWVPIVVPNTRNKYHRSRGSGIILTLVIFFLMFGVMFFIFFDRMNGFTPPIWIIISGFGVFLLIIAIVMGITVSMSQTFKRPNETRLNSYQSQPQKQSQQINPYNIRYTNQRQHEKPQYTEINQEIPVVSDINYCSFCGSKIEGDAVFCHQCGTKL